MKKKQKISFKKSFLSSAGKRRQFKAAITSEGFLRSMGGGTSNYYLPGDVLEAAVDAGMFNALAVFVDHASFFEYPEIERLVARIGASEWNEETRSVVSTVEFYDRDLANAMVNIFDAMLEDENPPDVGFSLVFWGAWSEREKPDDPWMLESISHVESADIVFEPAAEGARVFEALSARKHKSQSVQNGIPQKIRDDIGDGPDRALPPLKVLSTKVSHSSWNGIGDGRKGTLPPLKENNMTPIEEYQNTSELIEEEVQVQPGESAATMPLAGPVLDVEQIVNAVSERVANEVSEAVTALEERIDNRLEAAAVSEAEESAVQLGGQPPRSPNIVMGLNGYEELEQAARSLLSGSSAPASVRALSGIRELYLLLSGDYEMTGLYKGDRIQFAAVDSSTLANLFADVLNKMVIEIGELFPKWWDPAVSVYNFNTLHDAKWIVMGGVGELPTVAEGSVYTELTIDDQQEKDSFIKKGGYLGITLEAIDKDDTRKIQAIPRALVRAAWLTLGKAISAIFTASSGVGPTLDTDSVALFNAAHSNLGTTNLSFTAWDATRALMMAQTEINSSEPLGALNAPSLLWVPAELEFTALQIMASMNEPGTANNDVNPEAMDDSQRARLEAARRRVVVSPFWTDTNNWAAQANPMLYPAIGLGYRFGENPEIFSVSDPKAGLMFSNDVMPVKVRYFYAVGPMDYRPLYKHNVT